MDDCLFCRIVGGTLPSSIVYRDEQVTAFHDIQPQAPVHVLVVPNEHITSANHLEPEHEAVIGHVLRVARIVADEQGIGESGFRLVVNTGPDALMTIPHFHLHLLGGRRLGWPPG